MANHLRTQIRDAAKDLIDGLTTTSTRAYAGRPETKPLQDGDLPALLVYTNDTEVGEDDGSGGFGARRIVQYCDLVVEGYAKGTGDVDATLDTIEKEVRVALEAAPTLSALAKDLQFTGSEKENQAEAEQPTWRIRMTFRVEFHTREGVLDAALA